MSEFVMVRRELLERCIKANDEPQPSELYAALSAVLAQEADADKVNNRQMGMLQFVEKHGTGHVEEPLGMVEPVALISFPRELSDELAELLAEKARVCGGGAYDIWEEICEQFGSPPAPAAVVLGEVRALLATTNYSASRDCHNAQVVGAACDLLDKVKELNQ